MWPGFHLVVWVVVKHENYSTGFEDDTFSDPGRPKFPQPPGLQKVEAPDKFENNDATSQALIRCIVFYCFRNNCLPQSAAASYVPESTLPNS